MKPGILSLLSLSTVYSMKQDQTLVKKVIPPVAFSENLNYPVHTVRNEKPLNTNDSRAIKSILSYSAPEIGLQGPEVAERTLR